MQRSTLPLRQARWRAEASPPAHLRRASRCSSTRSSSRNSLQEMEGQLGGAAVEQAAQCASQATQSRLASAPTGAGILSAHLTHARLVARY